jgi:hypothetical protein
MLAIRVSQKLCELANGVKDPTELIMISVSPGAIWACSASVSPREQARIRGIVSAFSECPLTWPEGVEHDILRPKAPIANP